jgi:hypothetical protein
MKLPVPFVQLPLLFDAAALAAEVEAIDESSWRPHPQGFPGNSMLPLLAVDGDADNEGFAGIMRPTEYLQRCPYLQQVIATVGVTVGRTRLMRLSGQAEVTRHADQGYYWTERVRVHVPIVTQPTVRFECGDAVINMAAGECWIFDTWRQHRVLNDAAESRIHLVIDTVGGARFWDLVARGRAHNGPKTSPAWNPENVVPEPNASRELECEAVNVPTVMSPWELNSHFALLFADAVPHPNLHIVRGMTQRFSRHWQALWFKHGERSEGHAEYRAALDAYIEQVTGPAQPLRLQNQLAWYGAMMAIVAAVAIAPDVAIRPDAAAQRALGDNA